MAKIVIIPLLAKEGSPQGYQFKHERRISLDGYKGVASALMELNDPTADGFMSTADMRSDVVVTAIPRDRVREYDQLGHVRVAKMVNLPSLEFWKKDGLVHTAKREGVWMIGVNDQELSDQVARDNNGGRFVEAFVCRFRQEVEKGLKTCLKKEKLLNSGEYNFAFNLSYVLAMPLNIHWPALGMLHALYAGMDPVEATAKAVALVSVSNLMFNTINLASAGFNVVADKLAAKLGGDQWVSATLPNYQDPLVKHSIFEFVLPPVPVDRVVRGVIYLNKHGEKLIGSTN